MFAGMLQTPWEHPVGSCPSCSMTVQLHQQEKEVWSQNSACA